MMNMFVLSAHVTVDRLTPADIPLPAQIVDYVDYTEPMIGKLSVKVFADKDIQLELLGYAKQSPSLEKVLQFFEKKESSKWSAPRLSTHSTPSQQAAHTEDSNGDQPKAMHRNHRRRPDNPQTLATHVCTAVDTVTAPRPPLASAANNAMPMARHAGSKHQKPLWLHVQKWTT